MMRYLAHDDPPDYEHEDPDAEESADAAAELAAIEAEEAHDRAGEAWQEAAYQPGVSDPAGTSGPRGLA